MRRGPSKLQSLIKRASMLTLGVGVFACGAKNPQTAPTVASISIPAEKTEAPAGKVVDHDCIRIPETVATSAIDSNERQVSFVLDGVNSAQGVETAVMDETGELISSRRLCTTKAETVLLSLPAGAQRITILARDRSLGRIFVLENMPSYSGVRAHFGILKGSPAASFRGNVNADSSVGVTGAIEELKWTFDVPAQGEWTSGVLPPGQWSLVIRDTEGRTSRWTKVILGDNDHSLGALNLSTEVNSFAPLWQGILKQPAAPLLLNAQSSYSEMRVSADPSFMNSFWMPFRQVLNFPILASGKYRLFAQFRAPDGSESPILMSEFTAQVLSLNNQADAVVSAPLVGVESPETTIVTTPPPDAVEHSVTVDVEDLPRSWTSVANPLSVKLQASLESCGHHVLYIKFRDAAGVESPSLQRSLDVRCWEKNLPLSPLAARYEQGSVALTLSTEPGAENDAVFIWGGRNATQLFADGAILKKVDGSWTWQSLPPAPAELTARNKPTVVAGKNHVLVWGGEDLNGNPVSGWAFYNFRNNQWISQSTTSNAFSGNPPPAMTNAASGFITVLNKDRNEGAFLIIGGELADHSVSDKWYILIENSYGLSSTWTQANLKRAVARAGFQRAAHTGLLFVHSGISTPSGTPGNGNPADASGSAPELSGDVQAFMFYYDTSTSLFNLLNYQYKSYDSRPGALNAQLMIQSRPVPNTAISPAQLVELNVVCAYGGRTYREELPNINPPEGFGLRLTDSYFFSPIGKVGLCFQPNGSAAANSEIGSLKNYYLATPGAPAARRLARTSGIGISSGSMQGALFIWSGMSATSGEYLSDGAIFYSSGDKWAPVTRFEAPVPRNMHTAVMMVGQKRILIWGGHTAHGPTAEGAFYVVP